jgi:hypothetical protein
VGIDPELSDAELVTLAVMQALSGVTSEARWLRYARVHLRHLFPYLPQQPGFSKRLRPSAMAAGGAALLAGLLMPGSSMVDMAGSGNTNPPSIVLLAFAATRAGLLLATEPIVSRLLARPRPWQRVRRLDATVMTAYLRHFVPAIAVAVAFYPTGVMPQPAIGVAEDEPSICLIPASPARDVLVRVLCHEWQRLPPALGRTGTSAQEAAARRAPRPALPQVRHQMAPGWRRSRGCGGSLRRWRRCGATQLCEVAAEPVAR